MPKFVFLVLKTEVVFKTCAWVEPFSAFINSYLEVTT